MRLYNTKRIVVLLIAAVFVVLPMASNTASAQPAFDPHAIISDAQLEDYRSMDVEAIRSFLLLHGSSLATMQAVDASGTTRFVPEIIYNASQDYRINPKYTLVTLQKEQSLIEEATPTQKALDWALGYGICDSCSMSDPALQKYRGIGNQIDYAVGTQRVYLDDSINRPWLYQLGRTYSIDGTQVTMLNRATAALYNYTPHLHGNQLFHRLWYRYFNQQYPDGTLLKSASSPDVWLVEGGFRRRFASWTSLITRFDPRLIITVPQTVLDQLEPGRELLFSQYALLRNAANSKTYLYANDRKRLMDAETFRILGFNSDEVEDIDAVVINAIPDGNPVRLAEAYPLGAIVRAPTKELYLVQDGVKQLILDDKLLKFMFASKKIRTATTAQMAKYKAGDPVQLPDGTLARSVSSSAVYVISHGQRRAIVSGELFEELGYDWANVETFSDALINAHPFGQALTKVEIAPLPSVIPYTPFSPLPTPAAPAPMMPTTLPIFPPL